MSKHYSTPSRGRALLALCLLAAARAGAAEDAPPDAGAASHGPALAPAAPGAPAEAPAAEPFDWGGTPWGPSRRTSGEAFRSLAEVLPEGPFRVRGDGWSLGFGAQYFARGEARTDADFTQPVDDHALGFDHRARVTLRGSALGRVGALLELQDVRGWGSERSTVFAEPFAGLHQGFVDVRATWWLDLRVGRQELAYGEERLLGAVEWSQPGRAFDGLFARATVSPQATLDAFAMMLKPPAFVDSASTGARFHNSGSYLWGLYGRLRPGPTVGVDLYAIGLSQDDSSAATGPRRDTNLASVGLRATFKPGALSAVGEAVLQAGDSAAGAVLAGAFAVRGAYKLAVWSEPYVQLEGLGATGDGEPGDGRWSGFNQLFPTGHAHLGYLDYVGWQNVTAVRATVGFRPFGAHVWVDLHHFRLWDARGAWYGASGATFRAADSTRADPRMGTELDVSATVPITRHLSLAGGYGAFFPLGAAAAAPGAAPGADVSHWGFLYLRSQL